MSRSSKHGLLLVPGEAPAIVEFKVHADIGRHLWPDAPEGRSAGRYLIERVRVGEDWALAVDEEGRYRENPIVNPVASMLYGTLSHGTPIVGPAVLIKEGFGGDGIDWVDSTPEEMLAAVVMLTAGRMAEIGLRGEIGRLA